MICPNIGTNYCCEWRDKIVLSVFATMVWKKSYATIEEKDRRLLHQTIKQLKTNKNAKQDNP